uniref:Glycosyltransferase family 8 protein n=1 Tax=Panagrellus redivivus TaxID=6233 RepID=A0A7E4W7U1_PANRE
MARGLNRRYKYLLTFAICVVFVLTLTICSPASVSFINIKNPSFIQLLKNAFSNPSNSPQPRIAAILAVTLHKRYLFTLPFAVAAWQKLGVEPIVIIVGDYNVLLRQHQSKTAIDLVLELGGRIHFIMNDTVAEATLSQTSRLFAAAMPFSSDFKDDDIFITSDSDIIPFHLANHIPNPLAKQRLYIYNAACYGTTKVPPAHGYYSVPMYPMTTIGATVSAWREIMGFRWKKFSGEDIELYLKTEFGQNFFHPDDGERADLKSSLIWYADQALVSYKISRWFKRNSKNKWSTTLPQACSRRIDRADWPMPSNMSKIDLTEWDDAHVPEWGFKAGQWHLFKPLINRLFEGEKYEELRKRFEKYRVDYISKDCCDDVI